MRGGKKPVLGSREKDYRTCYPLIKKKELNNTCIFRPVSGTMKVRETGYGIGAMPGHQSENEEGIVVWSSKAWV